MVTTTGVIVGAAAAIVAAIVPQVIQLLRVRSDRAYEMARDKAQHGHELRRDHALRAFEYRKSRFERTRDACRQMIAMMEELRVSHVATARLQKEFEDASQEMEPFGTRVSQLESAFNEAQKVGDEAQVRALRAEIATSRAQVQELSAATYARGERIKELREQIAAMRRSAQELVITIVLDLRAEDISEKFGAFLRVVDKEPTSEDARRTASACVEAIAVHLETEEKTLVREPD